MERIKLSFGESTRILLPYAYHNIKEQVIIVVPVCLYLVAFQFFILRYGLERIGWMVGGISMVILGLAFFLEGVKIGLVPIGETVGNTLPKRSSGKIILTFAFVLGLLAAFGEPVIGSLQQAGSSLQEAHSPLLYKLLKGKPFYLIFTVAFGVGVAAVIGTMRFLYGWSLKPIVLPLIAIGIALTIFAARDQHLKEAIGLAWDAGAVIVGPVLCPLILALGLGVCRATGRDAGGMAGFGMVALISIIPITMVILLTFALSIFDAAPIAPAVAHAPAIAVASAPPTVLQMVRDSLVMGVQAILPIFAFLFIVMRFFLKERGVPGAQIVLAIGFAVFGLFLFNLGLAVGLSELGNQVGDTLPNAFLADVKPPIDALAPHFSTTVGKIIVVVFAIVLGYGATLAEPAFNVLGQQVEDVTQGAFKKNLFSQAVALGVGVGAGLGIVSLLYGIDLLYLLLPPYVVLLILTLVNEEKYVNIAWDGGAVTTGPVTVPLKLAIGLSLSSATGAGEGFGVLALASAYPVLNILLLGLYIRLRTPVQQVEAQ
ncbi:MAG: DUF1538 family protein [Spirochaetes bacterium]|nr:DUF1538 family protein [Spirochaetota bacterium]